jgi:hypothetical protein
MKGSSREEYSKSLMSPRGNLDCRQVNESEEIDREIVMDGSQIMYLKNRVCMCGGVP